MVSGSAERQPARALPRSCLPSKGYRTAFDSAPIGIAFVSPAGRWLQVNRALCRLVGYSEEQLLELNISDLTHPDDLEATLDRTRQQVQGMHAGSRIEKRYLRADGTTVWVAVTSTLVRDAAGSALYSVAEIENINDRVHAQAALSEAEERFRRAFNDAPIGMGLVALDGRWLRVNQRLTEITGFSGAQLLASTFQDITHPDDVDIDVEHSRQLLAGEVRSYQMEKRYVRPDGESIWVMLSVSLVRGMDDEPLYFISQVENINERKRVERELTRLAEHDSLTGLLNRRRFQQELERERKRARRPTAAPRSCTSTSTTSSVSTTRTATRPATTSSSRSRGGSSSACATPTSSPVSAVTSSPCSFSI